MNPLNVNPDNVWEYAQNKPSLIADDLAAFGVPRQAAYAILMARGVFKWLSVRRDLIRLKDHLRGECYRLRALPPSPVRDARLAAYHEVFVDIRALCHSDRWRAPDFDGEAWAWLRSVAPFKAGAWVETVRRIRHARVGSSDLSPAQREEEN